jgi:site-specific DNA-methyltransferase (adenine-specific)
VKVIFQHPRCLLLVGDCRSIGSLLRPDSIDSIVSDPPYELGFMGRKWDSTGIAYDVAMWQTMLLLLKPGAHLAAFGGTRTYHRMTCAIEDAGFEIRDCLSWLYGSGFPKSLDVSKAIDKMLGAERAVTGPGASNCPDLAAGRDCTCYLTRVENSQSGATKHTPATAPGSPEAAQWEGFGTALKPAYEPVTLARKPLTGTVAECVLERGTGAINVDACRIGDCAGWSYPGGAGGNTFHGQDRRNNPEVSTKGRWPANVVLDETAAALLDSVAPSQSRKGKRSLSAENQSGGFAMTDGSTSYEDSGGPSRFFYCAKASRSERELGCEQLPERSAGEVTGGRSEESAGLESPRAGAGRTSGALLDCSQIVSYPCAEWVNAVLSQMLPAGTVPSQQKAIGESTIRCSNDFVWSTCWCGSLTTDPFHPAIKPIIETKTSWTTESKISKSSPRPHTNGCIAAAFGVTGSGGSLADFVGNSSPWMAFTGTDPPKDGPYTGGVDPVTLEKWLKTKPERGGGRRVGVRNFHPT